MTNTSGIGFFLNKHKELSSNPNEIKKELFPNARELVKEYCVPDIMKDNIPEWGKEESIIYRDGEFQKIIEVNGGEREIFNYFSKDGEAETVFQNHDEKGRLVFVVSEEIQRLPSHEIDRISEILKELGGKLEVLSEKEGEGVESKYLPETGGQWSDEKGNSIWRPDPEIVPKKGNPEGKTWKDILEKYGINGIEFVDGEPDFSPVSEETVEIDDFSENRADNYAQADEECAKKWTEKNKDGKSWSPSDVREYRKENALSWHERSDMKTIDLVPTEIHSNIPHSGGISAIKNDKAQKGN